MSASRCGLSLAAQRFGYSSSDNQHTVSGSLCRYSRQDGFSSQVFPSESERHRRAVDARIGSIPIMLTGTRRNIRPASREIAGIDQGSGPPRRCRHASFPSPAGEITLSENAAPSRNVAGSLVEEFGGSLVNVILGGMLLWVGQTTFEHNGDLAGVHQQIDNLNARNENLHDRYDTLLESLNNRTKSRFTAEHGEKLSKRIDSVQLSTQSLREQLQDRLAEVRVQVSALEVQIQSSQLRVAYAGSGTTPQEMQKIHDEMASLRSEVSRLSRALNAAYKRSESQIAPAGDTAGSPRQASYRIHAGAH